MTQQLLTDLSYASYLQVLGPGELCRAIQAIEAAIKITPTVVLTNALPYDVDGMLLSVSARGARSKPSGQSPVSMRQAKQLDNTLSLAGQEQDEQQLAQHRQFGAVLRTMVQDDGRIRTMQNGSVTNPNALSAPSAGGLGGFSLGSVRRSIMKPREVYDATEAVEVSDAERRDIVRCFQQLAHTLRRSWTVSGC